MSVRTPCFELQIGVEQVSIFLSLIHISELWKAFYEEEIGSYDKLLMMSFMLASTGAPKDDDDYDEEDEEDIKAWTEI